MTAEVKHISFTITKEEIKALNRYRKEMKNVSSDFEIKLDTHPTHVNLLIKPKDCEGYEFEHILNYVR